MILFRKILDAYRYFREWWSWFWGLTWRQRESNWNESKCGGSRELKTFWISIFREYIDWVYEYNIRTGATNKQFRWNKFLFVNWPRRWTDVRAKSQSRVPCIVSWFICYIEIKRERERERERERKELCRVNCSIYSHSRLNLLSYQNWSK